MQHKVLVSDVEECSGALYSIIFTKEARENLTYCKIRKSTYKGTIRNRNTMQLLRIPKSSNRDLEGTHGTAEEGATPRLFDRPEFPTV